MFVAAMQTQALFSLHIKTNKAALRKLKKQLLKKSLYTILLEDGIGHTVWIIDDDSEIEKIVSYFKNIPSLYIADGHHRNASAANAAIEMRNKTLTTQAKKNLTIAFLLYSLQMNFK